MNLLNKIQEEYTHYFSKYETSKNFLLTGILYSIQLLSEYDIDTIKTHMPKYITKINSNDTSEVFQLLMSFILSKLALKIIYSLPHMLNKSLNSGSISVHTIFGENISQLVSFCLVTESTNLLNQIIKNNKHILHKIQSNILEENELILNYNDSNIPKNIINEDYQKKVELLIDKYNTYYDLFYKK